MTSIYDDPDLNLDDEDTDEVSLVPTDAVILKTDGTASLIRVVPDTETIAAIIGTWAYGISPRDSSVRFWSAMPSGLIILNDTEPMGVGPRNRLAQKVYRALSGKRQVFLGTVVAVSEGRGSGLVAAVSARATTVTNLRNPLGRRRRLTEVEEYRR